MSYRDSRRLFTDHQVRQLMIASDSRCERCHADLTVQPFEAHHIRPHAAGGLTQLHNGMVLCVPCHKEINKMALELRAWQRECLERMHRKFRECQEDNTIFTAEACMGSGKSLFAANAGKTLQEEYDVDHLLVLVPSLAIQQGMLETFGRMGLDARDRFFTGKRRQPRQPCPEMDATVTLYQEACCQEALDTLAMWRREEGFTYALICDEIHHTNEVNSMWGTYVSQLKEMAQHSIFLSGTYFRSDHKPISCIPVDAQGIPVKDFRYTYAQGVRDNVVRAVTTRNFNARVRMYDPRDDREYETDLNRIESNAEINAAKKQVLDPNGECIRHMIEVVHEDLQRTRSKFPDAACLFVCRPGGNDNDIEDGDEAQEDRHVHIIAQRIREITGCEPVVVTHADSDSQGKILHFRRGRDPYLVAVNMVSEGCDIPRLRAVAFARYTTSEMLFRQIVGRALRIHQPEDGTAAQIYIPAFPQLVEYAQRLYSEAQEGVRNRRCQACGEWPCACPCEACGQNPCLCPSQTGDNPQQAQVTAIDATPEMDGGHVGADHVSEFFVGSAQRIAQENAALVHSNPTQLGWVLQQFARTQNGDASAAASATATAPATPVERREQLRRQINRRIRNLAFRVYARDYGNAWHQEVERPFGEKFATILNTWTVDRLQTVANRLDQRIREALRRG